MRKKLYTWKHVIAYSIIALHNLLNSANDVNLKNIKLFIEPLQNLYNNDEAEKYAEKLLNNKNKLD